MRDFIRRALKKLNKLTPEQIQELLISAAGEIDRLETVLDSLTDGILVCDTSHNLVMVNKYAERFLPVSHLESGTVPVWNSIRDEEVRDFFKATLVNGDRIEEREFNLDVMGIQRLLCISVLPLVQDHQVSGSLIYIEDITEKRGKEARLRQAENLARLTTLAAGVAHEIKNPLGSISIHIQLMQKAMATNREIFLISHPNGRSSDGQDMTDCFDRLDKYIGVVNEEVDRLNRIVVDFLFAVRPMNMDLRDGDINFLIDELVGFVRYELEEARITCVLELAEQLPCIKFDERYMKQVLLNLIKNAIAAMDQGGVLTIKTEYDDTELRILVQDTGKGIPEEYLPKIFEPYFTTKDTGSGLGLTFVFKIIREHQGEVLVKSKLGEGTLFIIMLPIPQKTTRLLSFEGSQDEI
jgi:PAS domain S-box-containing protein